MGDTFDLIVAAGGPRDSTYVCIVHLVEEAQRPIAPMVRLAGRCALGSLAVTVLLSRAISWPMDDPVRAVAVLVVVAHAR